ncbi:hypothetical protein PF005_g20122 [Phytophthora fragariae]|uniref:Uncharacterized protein n=1 Tax=Phytophthora fragariae TaxID=53985 RepID=A0A6A3WLA1_9STRA|nr:hypothetical protein PF011_g17870 [Phytophthora fragariae]KAE9181931.1 hypothetical protein PF002_g27136 [Phytophthora fragariae]KAE9188278.1 hypothetical protein PF005_g20122 [Phytophthora fragariae]KAE9202515.1 hypothetical protein PF004_g18401 [Phytophthora fragariae]
MTTETQIIVRAVPNAFGAAGPAKPHADALAPSHEEEMRPAPASTKHSGDPEEAKDASAFKKPANDTAKAPGALASQKHAKDAAEAKNPPASKKLTASATKAKKTPASSKPPRKTKKVTASSKPAPKKPLVKKPAAKQLPKKKGAAKEGTKTPKLPPKRTDVLLPGPHEEVSSESSDTDTPNPGLIDDAGSAASRHSNAPRASASSPPRPDKANAATTPPQRRSPSPDPSLQVDYEESESNKDHEVGENAPEPWRRPCLAETTRPPAAQEPQVITNAGVDEGVPPELLQPENREHLADRSRQEASQAVGTKRDREAHAPRTREKLLALRYWTRGEYGEHLRQSRRPGPGAPQCDKCPVVLLSDSGLARQRNETEFEEWLHHLGYPEPEFLNSPFRIDWLVQRRLRFRMAKVIADDTWSGRYLDRHKPMPGVILEEVLQKIQKSWQSLPIEPKSVLGSVSADQVRGHAQKRPRGRRSPPRGEPQAPTSYDYSGSHATSPEDALITKQRRQSPQREWCRTRTLSVARVAHALTRRAFYPLLSPVSDCWMASGPEMVALRARVQDAEARLEKLQNVRRDLDFLRDRVWNLPRQLDEEAERLRTRFSRGEENDASVRQVLERHLDWIRILYDRVGSLEAQEARRVAARAPAPSPAPAPLPSEELVRMITNAFQQYSATQSAPQAQQPPPGDRA